MSLVAIAPSSLNRLFDGIRRAVGHDERRNRGAESDRRSPRALDPTSPAIDLLDEGDSYVLLTDLPGFEREDVSISVDDRVLSVEADSGPPVRRAGTYLRQEREGQRMSRDVPLPGPVDETNRTTRYRRGVLLVRLPKADAATQ